MMLTTIVALIVFVCILSAVFEAFWSYRDDAYKD